MPNRPKLIFLCILLISSLNLKSQEIEWTSAGAGNHGNSFLNSIVSRNENIYVSGFVKGEATIIQDSLIEHSSFHFLASYNINGDLRWINKLESNSLADISLNSLGEILVGSKDYIRKYDSYGTLIWEKRILENLWKKEITSILVDESNNILISGNLEQLIANTNPVVVEDTVLADLGYSCKHSFVIKFGDNGDFKWINSTHGGDFSYSTFRDLKTDNHGDVIAIGDLETQRGDSIFFGSKKLGSKIDTIGSNISAGQDIFITKFNGISGEVIWSKLIAGNSNDWGNKISINENNQIYATGTLGGSVYLESAARNFSTNLIYLCKLSQDGELLWSNTGGSIANLEAGRSIVTDSNGNVFIAGTAANTALFGNDDNQQAQIVSGNEGLLPVGFIAKYNYFGELSWLINTTKRRSNVYDLALQGNNLLVAGSHYPRTQFLGITLPVADSLDTGEYEGLYKENFFIASIDLNFTSVKEISENNILQVYPNPTSSQINLNLNTKFGKFNLDIFNSQGEIVISKENLQGVAQIDLSTFSNGFYFLRISNELGIFTKKILVAHN